MDRLDRGPWPEKTSEYVNTAGSILSTNSSLYLNNGSDSTYSYKTLNFGKTASNTGWGLEGGLYDSLLHDCLPMPIMCSPAKSARSQFPMNTPEGMSPREKELWLLRRAHEERHRCTIWRNVSLYTYHPFVDAPERQRLTDNDFLNTCNKAVPVYVFNRSCCYQRLFPIALHNYIYRRWFRPYRSELEHEQYVCKIIVPAILPHHDSSSRKTIESLVSLNKSLCDQVEARRPVYDAAVQGYMDIACERVPLKDHKYYQIQPLFRALLIIMDTKDYHSEGSEQIGDMRVSMVRTGVVDGLSAPITFESILGQGEVEASHDPDVVITTLRTAVDFVLALDNRERAAARDGMQSALVPAPEEWYTRHWKSYLGNEPVIFPSAKLVSDEKAEEYGRCGGFPAWDDMMVRMEERARRNNWTGLDLAKIRGSDHSSVEFP